MSGESGDAKGTALGPAPGPGPEEDLATWARTVAQAAEAGVVPLLDDSAYPLERHHPHALVLHHKTKTATCKNCSVEMTAFEALVYVAREWTMFRSNLTALQHELDHLAEKKHRLQDECRKLQAQKRRLQPKTRES